MKKEDIMVIMVIVILVLLIFYLFNTLSMEDDFELSGETYVVQSGDTLYGIADKQIGSNVDIREYIYELKKVNDIDSMVYPGQKIKLLKVKE